MPAPPRPPRLDGSASNQAVGFQVRIGNAFDAAQRMFIHISLRLFGLITTAYDDIYLSATMLGCLVTTWSLETVKIIRLELGGLQHDETFTVAFTFVALWYISAHCRRLERRRTDINMDSAYLYLKRLSAWATSLLFLFWAVASIAVDAGRVGDVVLTEFAPLFYAPVAGVAAIVASCGPRIFSQV